LIWLIELLIALAAISIWGTNISFLENFCPTLDIAGIRASSRISPGLMPSSRA
jgi:hypothetical protein